MSENFGGCKIVGGITSNITDNSIGYNGFGVFYQYTTVNFAMDNDVYSNIYGANVTNDAKVNAEYNYWGHSTRPYHESLNPEGQGNPVNGDGTDLDFIPFLTSPIHTINQRPVAQLEVDKTVLDVNKTLNVDGSGSTDDDRVDFYFFDFGDDTNSSWTTTSIGNHNYSSPGEYTINLTVLDNFGVKSINIATLTITVTEGTKLTSSISCFVSSSQVEEESLIIVYGSLNPSLSSKTMQLTYSKSGGSTISRTITTNLDGEYSHSFTPNAVGSWSVTASWEGDLIYEGATSASKYFNVL